MRPGDALETEPAARLSDAGDGVARAGSLQVHVPGLFVGERARVVVEHASRQAPRAHARLAKLLVEAPGRRSPPCRHHEARGGRCTGCPLMPLAEPAQETQRLATLRARFGAEVDLSFHTSPSRALGYRMSSKRVAFGAPGELRLGSFRRGSHEPADMADCLVDHPEIAAAARELAAVASDLGLTPYHDHAGAPAEGGDLRHVWLKTDGARVVVTLITASDESEAARRLPGRLTRADGLAWCVQADAGNTVRGHGLTVIHGDVALALQLADVTVHPGPLGFLQPNPEVAALAYRELVAGPDGQPRAGALAFDLYAGAGVTTALLRQRFERVLPCERYPESAAALGVPARSVEETLREAVAQRRAPGAGDAAPPDLVVANPPRRGLGEEACALLLELGAPAIHVMSCSARALARDLDQLAAGYRLVRLRAFDTLPQTQHVELIAWLTRLDKPVY